MMNPQASIPRYTALPLPPHRFLPGDRRPAEIPELPGPAAITSAASWRECTAYLYGCDLYNHGYWWESHEVWEDLWHQAANQPEPRLQHAFFQGLIQVAACAIKLEQRKTRGLERLLTTSTIHLRKVIDQIGDHAFMGLPLGQWFDRVQAYYRARHMHGDDFPYIELER